MERVKITVSAREKTGKEIVRKIRHSGEIPAVIYARGFNLPIQIAREGIKTLKDIHFSGSTIIDLDVLGSKPDNFSVLIKDVQFHPLTEEIIHVDFVKVSLTERIRVKVPVVLVGEALGVKEGGTLEQILWELEIEGLPLDVPEKITLDISSLVIGKSIHAAEVKVADNLKIITAAEETVATVVAHVEEEVAAPQAGAVPAEGPEVIKEKKPEDGQETEAEADKKEEAKPAAAGAKPGAAAAKPAAGAKPAAKPAAGKEGAKK
jgi:large subunit ribosomal protein L25